MRRLVQLLRHTEFHLFVFCLALALTNWPFLAVSAGNGLLAMYGHLYLLWAMLILLLFFINKSVNDSSDATANREKDGGDV